MELRVSLLSSHRWLQQVPELIGRNAIDNMGSTRSRHSPMSEIEGQATEYEQGVSMLIIGSSVKGSP